MSDLPGELLDQLLAIPETCAHVDEVVRIIREGGREPGSAAVYEHCAYNQCGPVESEQIFALIRRCLETVEAMS